MKKFLLILSTLPLFACFWLIGKACFDEVAKTDAFELGVSHATANITSQLKTDALKKTDFLVGAQIDSCIADAKMDFISSNLKSSDGEKVGKTAYLSCYTKEATSLKALAASGSMDTLIKAAH